MQIIHVKSNNLVEIDTESDIWSKKISRSIDTVKIIQIAQRSSFFYSFHLNYCNIIPIWTVHEHCMNNILIRSIFLFRFAKKCNSKLIFFQVSEKNMNNFINSEVFLKIPTIFGLTSYRNCIQFSSKINSKSTNIQIKPKNPNKYLK